MEGGEIGDVSLLDNQTSAMEPRFDEMSLLVNRTPNVVSIPSQRLDEHEDPWQLPMC